MKKVPLQPAMGVGRLHRHGGEPHLTSLWAEVGVLAQVVGHRQDCSRRHPFGGGDAGGALRALPGGDAGDPRFGFLSDRRLL